MGHCQPEVRIKERNKAISHEIHVIKILVGTARLLGPVGTGLRIWTQQGCQQGRCPDGQWHPAGKEEQRGWGCQGWGLACQDEVWRRMWDEERQQVQRQARATLAPPSSRRFGGAE